MKEEQVFHTIPPVYDETSRVLLLGTMPSPKSREAGFYYGHPQNRMWKVLGQVFGEETPMGTEARRAFLLAASYRYVGCAGGLHHSRGRGQLHCRCGAQRYSADFVGSACGAYLHHRTKGVFSVSKISPAGYGAGGHLSALHLTGQLPLGDRGYAHRSVQRAESGRRGMNLQANGEKHPKHTDFSRKVESYG